jgi:lipid biosynthesis B12-binding/radical SAM protein
MKILLISSNITKSPYPVYPLGLSFIAGALKPTEHTVKQFDFLNNDCSFFLLERKIETFNPDIIGISIRNIDSINQLNNIYYIDNVKDIVASVRKCSPAKIILGGSGFSIMPELILKWTNADYGIVGEGEKLFLDFANDAANNVFPEIKCIYSDSFLNGNDIGIPDYDSEILKYYLKHGSMISVQTKRGCPYHCIYCSYPILEGKTLRCRNPVKVVDDIIKLRDNSEAKFLFFTDSVFNDDSGHYLEVLQEMKRRNVSLPWSAFIKPGNILPETIELMKETGLSAVEIGADASTNTSLKKMGKPFSFDEIVKCNKRFRAFDISTAHYYMFGLPDETEKTVLEGIQNVLSVEDTVSFIFMGIRILPGTPLSEIALKERIINSVDNLLEPVYYLSPSLNKNWLEHTLTNAFRNIRNCIFPPNAMDNYINALHNMGHTGVLWDLMLKKKEKNT